MRRILIILGVFLFLLIGAAFAIPYFFEDRIVAEVKKAANANLNATLDFKDVSVSLFRHFPQLSVGLDSLSMTGKDAFEGIRLLQCQRLDVAVNLWSAIFSDQVAIKGLYLKKPDLRVFVLSDGRANYDITKPAAAGSSKSTASDGSMKLEHYEISDGNILYEDRTMDLRADLRGVNHEGNGEFTADVFDIKANTRVAETTINYGGINYLKNAKIDWQTLVNANMPKMRFTIQDNDMKINAFDLSMSGWVETPDNGDINMELTFGTPENSLKSLLSLVPGAYTKDFDGVKADGSVQFAGFVNGTYNEKKYPKFKVATKVDNGSVQYPGMPMSIKKVEMDASVENTSTDLSNLSVSIPNFNLNVGSSPLEGYFYLKNPTTDPAINTKIKGKLNLRDLKNAVPMEDVQELSGMLDADVLVNATLSQLEKQQYEDAKMQGHFKLNSFKYLAKGTPPVEISALDASLSPQKLDLRRFDMKYGKSDFRANGAIDNVLAYFSTNKTMTGAMNLRSTNIDANELMGTSSTTTTETKPSDAPATTEKAFDRWDFKVDALVDNLKYETYTLRNLGLRGHFTPNKWLIDEYALKTGASDLNGSGQLLNVWAYMFDQQTVSGNLKVNSNYFDLNPFMTPLTPTAPVKASTPPAPPAVFLVPKNVNVQVDADMKQVKYTTYNIQNLNGSFSVHDQAAAIKDVTADIFGAQVAMKGAYETSNPAKPLFDLDFALKNMGFKEAFAAFSTAKSFAPIMQFIDGKFNTALTMSGTMGKDMTPELTTLNAAGGLQTLSAVINNVKPLTEIGNKLNIDALKRMELKDFKTWFEIKDGKVTVKPFNMQVKDIAMQVAGTHGLNQDMNYQITTKVPRKTLEQNAVGAAASGGLNFITQQAKQAGINIQQGEFINVRFDLTGNLTNPKVNMKVLGSDGQSTLTDQAENTAQAAIDDAKDKAQAELDKAKGQAQKEIDRATDSLQREAQRKMDQLKKEAEQKVKDEVGKVIGKEAGDDLGKKAADEIGKKAEDAMGDKGKKAVDDAKKKLDEWDPFKKKKN
jgi:hypothetical protein